MHHLCLVRKRVLWNVSQEEQQEQQEQLKLLDRDARGEN